MTHQSPNQPVQVLRAVLFQPGLPAPESCEIHAKKTQPQHFSHSYLVPFRSRNTHSLDEKNGLQKTPERFYHANCFMVTHVKLKHSRSNMIRITSHFVVPSLKCHQPDFEQPWSRSIYSHGPSHRSRCCWLRFGGTTSQHLKEFKSRKPSEKCIAVETCPIYLKQQSHKKLAKTLTYVGTDASCLGRELRARVAPPPQTDSI